ncbi:MAG: DUF3568 family protein [Phycisphaeraceae bacterium]
MKSMPRFDFRTLPAPHHALRKAMLACVLLASLASLSGCLLAAGAAAGAGSYAWVSGNATGKVQASPDRVSEAAREVLDKHDVVVFIDEQQDDGDLRIVGENPAGKNVRILIDPIETASDPTSELKLRVGTVGNREASAALWHEIKRKAE